MRGVEPKLPVVCLQDVIVMFALKGKSCHVLISSSAQYVPEARISPLFSPSRETVSSDFMAACQFLKDHMDNMENPNDDMVRRRGSSTGKFNQYILMSKELD